MGNRLLQRQVPAGIINQDRQTRLVHQRLLRITRQVGKIGVEAGCGALGAYYTGTRIGGVAASALCGRAYEGIFGETEVAYGFSGPQSPYGEGDQHPRLPGRQPYGSGFGQPSYPVGRGRPQTPLSGPTQFPSRPRQTQPTVGPIPQLPSSPGGEIPQAPEEPIIPSVPSNPQEPSYPGVPYRNPTSGFISTSYPGSPNPALIPGINPAAIALWQQGYLAWDPEQGIFVPGARFGVVGGSAGIGGGNIPGGGGGGAAGGVGAGGAF